MALTTDVKVLNDIYRGSKLGSTAIDELCYVTKDQRFTTEIRSQDTKYRDISGEAASQLCRLGYSPEKIKPTKQLTMRMSVRMNALMDTDTTHFAQMMIKGNNMGIIDITKSVNRAEDLSPPVRELSDKLSQTQQANIESLKSFLR